MRIAQIAPAYPPYRGGMGNVAHAYATRLRARGHDVHVFTPRRSDQARGDVEPSVHRLDPLIRLGNASLLPSLARRLDAFDIAHLHYPFFGGAEPVVFSRRHRAQRIVLSYYMDPVASGFRGRIFDLHQRIVLPRVIARADRVLVSSRDYAAHSALARVSGAVDRAEIHPFGVDLDRFHPGAEPRLRNELGIADADPVLLFVGGLDAAHHFKGLPVLFDALEELRGRAWRLIVVGDGNLRSGLALSARDRGIGDRMTFAGNVSDDELPRFYRLARVHVLPSTARAEAFGLVTLEAAASGVPSIVSDLPGVREIVRKNETGLLARPGDAASLREAIGRTLDEPDLCDRMGRAARERAEGEFAWDPLVVRLEQTYEATLRVASRRA